MCFRIQENKTKIFDLLKESRGNKKLSNCTALSFAFVYLLTHFLILGRCKELDLSLKCSSLLPQKKEKAEVFVDHAWTKIGSTNNEGGENHGFILTATEKGVILVLQLNEEGHSEIRQTQLC